MDTAPICTRRPAPQARLRCSAQPEVLQHVGPPRRQGGGPDLAVWQRAAPAEFQAWLDALPDAALPCVHRLGTPSTLDAELQELLEAQGPLSGPMRKLLLADVGHLTRRFARLSGCDQLSLRLGDLRSEVDRQWLCMAAPLRLVCSYRGPASECSLAGGPSLEQAWFGVGRPNPSLLAPMDVAVFNARGRMLHRRPRFLQADGRPRPWALGLVAAAFDVRSSH